MCILFHICVWTGFVKRIHVRVYIYMYNYLGSLIFSYLNGMYNYLGSLIFSYLNGMYNYLGSLIFSYLNGIYLCERLLVLR